MTLSNLELSTEDRAKLLDIVAKESDWRARHRAQTLLYFNDGWSAKVIVAQQELNLDTVYDRRKKWLIMRLFGCMVHGWTTCVMVVILTYSLNQYHRLA